MRIIHAPDSIFPWQAFFDDEQCVVVDRELTKGVLVTGVMHEGLVPLEVAVQAVPEKVIELIRGALCNQTTNPQQES